MVRPVEKAREPALQRLKVVIHGAVQGVGFRPFVYRLATSTGLKGWVINDSAGVQIEVEGPRARLSEFRGRLEEERPPLAVILSLEATWLDPVGYRTFNIRQSQRQATPTVLVLPDVATCRDCRQDLFERSNRRRGYPFTNCTNCGPRYSLIGGLPYDRPQTTMVGFRMCRACDQEYHDPGDRRFHAQPNACARCGPGIELWDARGSKLSGRTRALDMAVRLLGRGKILALKGLGGYQLLVEAGDETAVERLREQKHREEKPLALMFPDLKAVREVCRLRTPEIRLLNSPESPIVLLRAREDHRGIAPNVAPDNPYLGVMLPYTPLHHLLLARLGRPVVATSGNLSEEPMAISEEEALDRLGGIADGFLVHNRPILRAVDDSVVRLVRGRELVLRRARGYAPLPITFGPGSLRKRLGEQAILAVGPHLKNTVALAYGGRVFLSQHIGDLATHEAFQAFQRVIRDLSGLLEFEPRAVACDLHPDYLSTRHALELSEQEGIPLVMVQHHEAHIASAMAENALEEPILGFAWDGTGLGRDGTVWGGECFTGELSGLRRVGHLRTFKLPGGDRAAKEPRRVALALLHELGRDLEDPVGEHRGVNLASLGLTPAESSTFNTMLEKGVNSPLTSSVGRLFDGVAALLGLRQVNAYEGQAAMALEFCLPRSRLARREEPYPWPLRRVEDGPAILDWGPMLEALLEDVHEGLGNPAISARFHNGLVEGMLSMARRVGQHKVVLSGGCFQNVYLVERAMERLESEGFSVYTHQRVPPNDGGIALGQAVLAAYSLSQRPDAAEGLHHS